MIECVFHHILYLGSNLARFLLHIYTYIARKIFLRGEGDNLTRIRYVLGGEVVSFIMLFSYITTNE